MSAFDGILNMEHKQTVLIVDDEPLNLRMLSNMLRPLYTVSLAKSGNQAIERAQAQKPDLILLDILMEGMDGYAVIRRLKEDERTRNIPVIFITALDDAAEEEKGLQLGAVDYITKPFHPAVAKARVANHMRIVRQRKLLESIASLDGLTEIPNRRSFSERLDREWRRVLRSGGVFSAAIMDVDHFKQYNDQYGHAEGDAALRAVARVLLGNTRRAGDFAARIGGEEFAMLLPDTDAEGAVEVCEAARKDIAGLQLVHAGSPFGRVTVSIGGATLTPDRQSRHDQLMARADSMLYECKGTGRNKTCWSG